MEQLTTLDAGFLQAEDSDRHVSLAIGGIAIIDGPIPDDDALLAALGERLRAAPRFTQVLNMQPFDVGAPGWVEDPAFDLAHHLRRAALPRPGDDAALHRLAADIMERRLDRDRPLWECWIIEGLPDGRWAILMKIHHCIADGVSAAHVLAGLCDGDGGTFAGRIRASHPAAERPGSWLPSANPLNWPRQAWQLSTAATGLITRTAGGAAQIIGGLIGSSNSSLNGPVGTLRRYAAVRVSLEDVQHVCRRFDVTVNDVALAAISEGFRSVLLGRGERPRRDSLRTLVPVSVRATDALGTPDNRVSVMLPYLPVEQDDPVQRLTSVHRRLERAKRSGQRQAGTIFVSAARYVPFAVSAWTVRLLTRLPQRGVVTLATNVPGPRHRVTIVGKTVVRLLPIPPIALRLRVGIAMLTYADDLTFGILADFDSARDLDVLADGIAGAVARLSAISEDAMPQG